METFDENIVRLIRLALSGDLNEHESRELEAWCCAKKENQEFYDKLCHEELFSREFPLYNRINEEKAIQCFEVAAGGNRREKSVLFRRLVRYAAILILPLLIVGVWQWNRQQPADVVVQAVLPGSSKAVLTLGDGGQMSLTGQLGEDIEIGEGIRVKQQAGILAYDLPARENAQRVEYNTLSTGRGGEYRLVLADGTKVFLNAASKLTYPVVFKGKERKVQLEGEAYFEVAKDATHSFIVATRGIEVKVYGTSFNINTYRTEEIQTVLVEGNISVRANAGGREYKVHPGQMALWKQGDAYVELKEVDTALYTAWKEGIFRFSNERLENILVTLSNWYDVDVFYQTQGAKNLHFSGYMERYEQIGTILEAITVATGVKFSVQGKTIVVSE